MLLRLSAIAAVLFGAAAGARADRFYLLVGVDALHYPGPQRLIPPFTMGPVFDGDRLAGTSDIGPAVPYVGTGTPMYPPNHLGSLSLMFRRGNIPFGGGMPIIGIEFLGGPLLDLDGDLTNNQRSLIPVPPAAPVEIPGSGSFIELVPDYVGGTITLVDFDATGCNEGGPRVGPYIATILVTIAGTGSLGEKTGPINPGIDTRVGTLTPFPGTSGALSGVYRIQNLGYELWEDSIDPNSSSADQLGTMQFLGSFGGWLIRRGPASGQFPTLAGQGLGSPRWPQVDTSQVGNSFHTAIGYPGGMTTIIQGVPGDDFAAPGNGGLALTDFAGDLGAYLDQVVVPRLPFAADAFVYLDSAGFGINNSADPVFTDTIGYDTAFVAATASCGVVRGGDSNCDGLINFDDINPFVAALVGQDAWLPFAGSAPGCTYLCANDANRDGLVNFDDINPFVAALVGGP